MTSAGARLADVIAGGRRIKVTSWKTTTGTPLVTLHLSYAGFTAVANLDREAAHEIADALDRFVDGNC